MTVTFSVWLPSAVIAVSGVYALPSSFASVVVAVRSVMTMRGRTSRLNFVPVSKGRPDSVMLTTGGVLSTMKTIGGSVVTQWVASVTVTVSVCEPSAETSDSEMNGAPSSLASMVVALMSVTLIFGRTLRANSAPVFSGAPDSVTVTTGGVLSMKKWTGGTFVIQPAASVTVISSACAPSIGIGVSSTYAAPSSLATTVTSVTSTIAACGTAS